MRTIPPSHIIREQRIASMPEQLMARVGRGILVVGGGTFLGDNIAAALLAEGAKVSLLMRPGTEEQSRPLLQHSQWSTADVWSPASLRGKARLHSAVIHTVGSLHANPAQGQSFQRLNLVSARNVANMCVSDGVERLIFISSVNAPWMKRAYIRSKRDAERYLKRQGLHVAVVRAPLVYVRGQPRPVFYRAMTLMSRIPPLSWLPFGKVGPMPIDLFARGVARLAISADSSKSIYTARDLRRLCRRGPSAIMTAGPHHGRHSRGYGAPNVNNEDGSPFAWSPDDKP